MQFAGLHQVAHAARGADDNVRPTTHRFNLLKSAGPTDDDHSAQTQVDGQRADGFVNLQSQLAGRSEYQRACYKGRRPDLLGCEVLKNR